jgi:SAM-dependent methyltransferase
MIPAVRTSTREEATAWQRVTAGVCRRAFSSPEALLYEIGIASAVAGAVSPLIIPHMRGPLVLDVGCGGGRVAAEVAAATNSTVIGIDPSLAQVKRLARRVGRRSSVRAGRAEAEKLPFHDRSFDAVYSSCALKHWPSAHHGLAECARVGRSGAPVVIVEIDGAGTPPEMRAFARLTRVPLGLREAYVRFAMRTIVGVAPDAAALVELFDDVGLASPTVEKVPGLPFLVLRTAVA